MLNMFTGLVCGITLTILAVHFLYGARGPMMPSPDAFHPRAYFVVGEKRFDWFSNSRENAIGGYTWDGRRITAVYVFGNEIADKPYRDDLKGCDPIRNYPKQCPK